MVVGWEISNRRWGGERWDFLLAPARAATEGGERREACGEATRRQRAERSGRERGKGLFCRGFWPYLLAHIPTKKGLAHIHYSAHISSASLKVCGPRLLY